MLLALAGGGVAAALVGLFGMRRKATGSGPGKARKLSDNQIATYLPALQRYAKIWSAPASLVAAIVANESGFDPKATNLVSPGDVARGGAWGLAQLTLKTALGLVTGKPGLVPSWDRTGPGLLDPDINLNLAAYGVGQNWRRYKDKRPNPWLYAGVAWNTGAGAVDRMIAAGPGHVEAFPYGQHLLQQVKNNPAIQALYDAEVKAGAHYAEVYV